MVTPSFEVMNLTQNLAAIKSTTTSFNRKSKDGKLTVRMSWLLNVFLGLKKHSAHKKIDYGDKTNDTSHTLRNASYVKVPILEADQGSLGWKQVGWWYGEYSGIMLSRMIVEREGLPEPLFWYDKCNKFMDPIFGYLTKECLLVLLLARMGSISSIKRSYAERAPVQAKEPTKQVTSTTRHASVGHVYDSGITMQITFHMQPQRDLELDGREQPQVNTELQSIQNPVYNPYPTNISYANVLRRPASKFTDLNNHRYRPPVMASGGDCTTQNCYIRQATFDNTVRF
eukprot:CFRG1614T1